jgi:hypothetical protein
MKPQPDYTTLSKAEQTILPKSLIMAVIAPVLSAFIGGVYST